MGVSVYTKVAAHRSFKPPKHDLGRVQSIQQARKPRSYASSKLRPTH